MTPSSSPEKVVGNGEIAINLCVNCPGLESVGVGVLGNYLIPAIKEALDAKDAEHQAQIAELLQNNISQKRIHEEIINDQRFKIQELEEALEIARDCIEHAIGDEDGLDGSVGERAIKRIEQALTKSKARRKE